MAEASKPGEYKGLIARLPRTFGPALNDQLAHWDSLFPAEQRQLRGQLEWLSSRSDAGLKSLFTPIVEIESRMDLPKWSPDSKGISVEDAGVIARSPQYPQWRHEIEKAFAAMDQGGAGRSALPPLPRLIACILPAGLPEPKTRPWPKLAKQGTWITLDAPLASALPALIESLDARRRPAGVEDVESTWVFECTGQFAPPRSVVLDWKSLEPARREFLDRLNSIKRDLKSVDETNSGLRRADVSRLLPPAVAQNPRVREFIRNVLLSGNGSLVFPSSFVQWGASEAIRRAQPQVLLALFGLRQKLKPFSSAVLFENQHRNNPAGDEDDPAGSLIDAEILAEYVYLSSERVPAYQPHTLGLFALADSNRVLLTGELPDGLRGTMKVGDFSAVLLRWIQAPAPEPHAPPARP